MRPFVPGKTIRRRVTIKTGDPTIPDREWVLEFSADGLGVRHLGTSRNHTRRLPWRSVVANVVMANFGRRMEKTS